MNEPQTDNEVLTVPQMAKYLAIGKTKAWELVWSGNIPSFHPGGRLRKIRRAELLRWIEEREAETATQIETSKQ